MTFEEAKVISKQLNDKVDADSKALKQFDQYRNSMGLVPDHIRETPEYQTLKNEFNKSFAQLRNFNGWYVKQFKKELAAERRNRFKRAN